MYLQELSQLDHVCSDLILSSVKCLLGDTHASSDTFAMVFPHATVFYSYS